MVDKFRPHGRPVVSWLFKFNDRGRVVVKGNRRRWIDTDDYQTDIPRETMLKKMLAAGLIEMEDLGTFKISLKGKEALKEIYGDG